MSGKRGKKTKFKKIVIPLLKWISAIVPVCAFIYILYYYKQFDFLESKNVVKSETKVIGESDSLIHAVGLGHEEVIRQIKVSDNEWHTVGGIAIHSLVIENASNALVRNAEVEFRYLNELQALVTSKVITIKTPLRPHKSTKISGLSVGYVNNSVVGCDVKVIRVGL